MALAQQPIRSIKIFEEAAIRENGPVKPGPFSFLRIPAKSAVPPLFFRLPAVFENTEANIQKGIFFGLLSVTKYVLQPLNG